MKALLYAFVFIAMAHPLAPVESHPASAPVSPPASVVAVAQGLVGVCEATGHNDGPEVEAMLHAVDAGKGDPWCAAFNFACFSRAGFGARVPRSAWSPSWLTSHPDFKWARPRNVLPGTVFGVYFPSKGRIAHTGIVEKDAGDAVITIEGNTNGGGSRDGDGVYRRRRLKSQLWLKDWL